MEMAADPSAAQREKTVPCPFHPEGEPTLKIDLTTGHYHCDLCGASGILTPQDGQTLAMEFRDWNFI